MLLRHFPKLGADSRERRAFFAAYGRENLLVHATGADVFYPEHPGPLSLRWTVRGTETYWLRGVPLRLEAGRHLVLNPHTRYASEIAPGPPCESLTIFFARDFAERLLAAESMEDGRLLENPDRRSSVRFVETIGCLEASPGAQRRPPSPRVGHGWPSSIRAQASLGQGLTQMHAALSRGAVSDFALEEACHALLLSLLEEQRLLHRRALSLSAVRVATRHELFVRVTRARDFLMGASEQPLRIGTLAKVAAMAPHHFLRVFSEAFGTTPGRLLRERRLERAATSLAESDDPVETISAAVGFESHAAFSRSFRRAYGTTPSAYRAAVRR